MNLNDVLKMIDGYITEPNISAEWREALNICKGVLNEKVSGGVETDVKNLNPYVINYMWKEITSSTEYQLVFYLPFKLDTVDNIKMFTESLKSRLKGDDLVITNIRKL